MKSLRLGFDVDGVVINISELKAWIIKKEFKITIPSWQCRRKIIVPNVLTKDQYLKVQGAVFNSDLGLLANPISGALFYILKLFEEGHQIIEITSRKENGVEIARKWFSSRNINIEVMTKDERGSKVKAATGLDLYVDDDLHKLMPMIGVGKHLFLFNHRHNEIKKEPSSIKRVDSWEDIYEKIKEIRKE